MEEDILKLTGETDYSDVEGSSVTSTGLKPVQYAKDVIDGAKKEMYFAQAVKEYTLADGHFQMSIPVRNRYFNAGDATWNTAGSDGGGSGSGTGPYANTQADITFTAFDKVDNVVAKPLPYIFAMSFRRWDLQTNALNLLDMAKEDMQHGMADKIDSTISTTIGDATAATDTAQGCQVLFGGDAVNDTELTAGTDVLETDLIAKAKRRLQDSKMYFRASGQYGSESVASAKKNPWNNTSDDPFVLFVSPAQAEVLETDSPFVNASEYGSREVILNGEAGKLKYLGIKIVVTDNVERVASGDTAPDGSGNAGTDMTRCILMKAKKACALVWGKQPEARSWENNDQDSIRVGIFAYYDSVVVQPDAIVLIDVADE